jgi:hydroxypyruvate isomerase
MMFNEVPFPERFAAASKAGFKAVEFLFPYDHPAQDVVCWLRENGLESVLVNLPPGDWTAGERGLASLPGSEEAFRASVTKALDYAQALGTLCLHAMAGLLPDKADRARHRKVYVENLRFAAKELARHHRTLLIEPINTRDMPGYFLNPQGGG